MKTLTKMGAERKVGRLRRLVAGMAIGILAGFSVSVSAATVVFCLSVDFSSPDEGSACPCCPHGDWVTVTISDNATGGVLLEIAANNLQNEERVMDLFLNLSPALAAADLQFANPVKVVGDYDLPQISLGNNAFKAAGDGYFDIWFRFSSSMPRSFKAGDLLRYEVTIGGGEFRAEDFNYWSHVVDEGAGPFLAAAHILSTGEDAEQSAWIGAIPEPAPLAFWITGVLVLLARHRRTDRA